MDFSNSTHTIGCKILLRAWLQYKHILISQLDRSIDVYDLNHILYTRNE